MNATEKYFYTEIEKIVKSAPHGSRKVVFGMAYRKRLKQCRISGKKECVSAGKRVAREFDLSGKRLRAQQAFNMTEEGQRLIKESDEGVKAILAALDWRN